MKIFIISIFTLLSSTVYARLSNESELGILIAKGNSDSENWNQKYNSDIGVKYSIIKEKNILWNAELGYRHTIENQLSGSQNKFNYVRAYTEVTRNLAENISSKIDIEYLPNFSVASDYQMNGEFSITASLNNIFSIKTGYQLRYNNLPNPGAVAKTDTLFTTALLAKF